MERRFLINCDDLGMHPTINEAIVRLLAGGIIQSASLMPPGRYFEDAVRRLSDGGITRVGVHLTANSEYPALATGPVSAEATSLTQTDGTFFDCPTQTAQHAVSSELATELEAQISKVEAAGLAVSHLDGHMFFYEPAIAGDRFVEIVRELAARRAVPFRLRGYHGPGRPRRTHFIWEEHETQAARHDAYAAILADPLHTDDEILIHPALDPEALRTFTAAGERRIADFTFFDSPRFHALIQTHHIRVVGWDGLA